MESLDTIFDIAEQCKEHSCKVNKKNIKKVYKPDSGFLDKTIEDELFSGDYKICDCIVECEDDSLFIVEILCGKLTNRELKEKKEQLANCCRVVKHLKAHDKIKKLVLLYDKLESPKRQPSLKKALINQRICNRPLEFKSEKLLHIGC
ncbi:MAG: hypothetical protein U9O24_10715 [Campylobacterota bacterium]|nr:hypothetical protein [Campylobacterota bacterium]